MIYVIWKPPLEATFFCFEGLLTTKRVPAIARTE